MKLKIMLTGHNRRIAMDISEHLSEDRGCVTLKCPPKKAALFEMSLSEAPNVIIICLGDENADTVKAFDVLKEAARLGTLTIIVVANEDDRETFINNTELDHMFFLERPVPLLALYEKLNEVEKKLDESGGGRSGMLMEYVNPDAGREHPRKHILVVDDDSEQLLQIKEHLKEFYEVTLLNSGKHVIRCLQRHKMDLILLDYMMPEMDGPEVLERLRGNSDYKDIPVVFLTGVSEKETVIKTLVELKPQGYILKPSKKSEIVAKIIDVLG